MATELKSQRGVEFEQAVKLLSQTLTNQGLVSNEGESTYRPLWRFCRHTLRLLNPIHDKHPIVGPLETVLAGFLVGGAFIPGAGGGHIGEA